MNTTTNTNGKSSACILLGAVAACAFSVALAGDYDDYVQLTGDDTVTSSSFFDNAAGRWKKNGVVEVEGPHAGEKYYVPANRVLTTSNVTANASSPIVYEFRGDELVVENMFWLILKRSSTSWVDDAVLRVGNLVLLPGGHIYTAADRPAVLEGVCTIKGTSSNPSKWRSAVDTGRPMCRATFVGGADNCFQFKNEKSSPIFRYDGDASRFFGTMRVSDANTQLHVVKKYGSDESGFNFPGTVQLSNGAILRVQEGETATIGNLDSDGGALTIGVLNSSSLYATLVVTNAIATHGKRIPVSYSRYCFADAETFAPIMLAAGASGTLSADDFAFTLGEPASTTSLNGCPEALRQNLNYAVVTGEGGAQELTVSHRKIVYLDEADKSTAGSFMLDENASHLSDDSVISSLNDYYIGGNGNAGYFPAGTHTFKGATLTVCGSGNALWIRGANSEITVPDFHLIAKSSLTALILCDVNSTIKGKIRVVDVPGGAFRFECWNGTDNKCLTLASEIDGAGTLDLASYYVAASPIANYALTGLNTNFTGCIRLSHRPFTHSSAATLNEDPDKYCVTLTVSDQRNLGGACPAFVQDSLSLATHSRLKVSGSVTFDEPTRGWFVGDVGRINVAAGETVTVTNKQITYAGEFRKEGDGALRLGGTAKFTAEALDTPLEGTNVLKIAAGTLTPADTTCCDGLAITFATGSKLVLDAAATGDLKTYGLYDVKWDSPITVEGGAPLSVAFDLPDGFNKTIASSFGICTVSPTAAASLDVGDFDVAKVKGMKSTVRKVENRDGEDNVVSVTFVCDLEPSGLILLFR